MTLIPTGDPAVSNNRAAQRYEIRIDDRLGGFVTYRTMDSTVVFIHTEIDAAFEGQGLGSRLAKAALDDVRQQHLTVQPLCPFIAGYIERHPDYDDLVVPLDEP